LIIIIDHMTKDLIKEYVTIYEVEDHVK